MYGSEGGEGGVRRGAGEEGGVRVRKRGCG